MPTVAAIVIGEEILTGKFVDENGPFFIEQLRSLGADLRRLIVMGDEVDLLAREVAWAAENHDWVITTGGVGPTHDDVTLEAIAKAFQVGLQKDASLVALMEGFGISLNEAALRMARIPEGCQLLDTGDGRFPVLQMRNVFVLPGVPKLMQRKFGHIADVFRGAPPLTDRLYCSAYETEIAAHLSKVQDDYPQVSIGSYPRFGEGPWNVIVTLESRDAAALAQASSALRQVLPLLGGPEPER